MVTTARLRLRPLTRHDLSLFRELYGDKETVRYIGRPLASARALASLRATVSATGGPGELQFFVIQRRRGPAIGLCSIRPTVDIRCQEIGVMLLREARGYGYATEALGMLMTTAFQALPISSVSVQYRHANASMASVCDNLGFARPARRVNRRTCIRILRRPQWLRRIQPLAKGKAMPNIIGFLEQAGRNAAMRHATREQLLRTMRDEEIGLAQQRALLQSTIGDLIGARETMYCINTSIKPPQKKKAPAKKKPAKAPPKKMPAKKPAKKAPSKRKK